MQISTTPTSIHQGRGNKQSLIETLNLLFRESFDAPRPIVGSDVIDELVDVEVVDNDATISKHLVLENLQRYLGLLCLAFVALAAWISVGAKKAIETLPLQDSAATQS